MAQMILAPWAPWASGILLGLMVPALYVLVGRRFGLSSSLRHIGAMCMPNAKPEYLRLHNWKDHSWNLVFVVGLLIGSFVGVTYLTTTPLEVLPPAAATAGGLLRLAFGGILVGFGTRYAGGCTSGHTITGIASLNPPSVVATVAFFAGGLLSTWGLTFLIF